MNKIFTTTLRLNLENENDRRAYEYLRSMNRTQYKSYSSAIVTAVNDHFSRQERLTDDPFLETRERQEVFLSEIKDTIRESLQTSGAGIAVWRRSCRAPSPRLGLMKQCLRKLLTQRWTSSTAYETKCYLGWYLCNTNAGHFYYHFFL